MLRLKIHLRVRRSVRVKCPRHTATTQSMKVQGRSGEDAAIAWQSTSCMQPN